MNYFLVFFVVFAIGLVHWMIENPSNSSHHLYCPAYKFKLKGMTECESFLDCEEIWHMKIHKLLGYGTVKDVFLASWENNYVALSKLKNPQYAEDFLHGLNMLKVLSPSLFVVQLVGYCEKKGIIITEYHPLGNAVNIINILKQSKEDSVIKRLNLCLNYARILNYLHDGPSGTRVFCDSNNLEKLLSQLLVTDDMRLVMSDMDALPRVTLNNTIICGHREITGSFVAPEQLWKYNVSFNESMMTGYNEKTDIWKAADVCNHFLKDVDDNEMALYRLFSIHKQCRSEDPASRPTAADLVIEYTKVIKELSDHSEL